jgi:hypothetical protein
MQTQNTNNKPTSPTTTKKLWEKKALILLVIFIGVSTHLNAQNNITLNGYLRDAADGEELIGATVYITELETGAVSNFYGFYSITLAPGTYTIKFSYIGYQTVIEKITLDKDVVRNIELLVDEVQLKEIVITAEAEDVNVQEVAMSIAKIDVEQVKELPALFGEADIIKNVQIQPGVTTAGEGTSGYFVRGGTSDQNLIQIDEAPIYDPSHLFGLFSVFNADVIKGAELQKGGIPVQYGGRLSSILDVRTKDGNTKELAGSAGLGLLARRVMVEGPIKKDESSFIVAARTGLMEDDDQKVSFYDVNAKINWRKNNNNRFFLSTYLGRDAMKFGGDGAFGWGNATATLRWNHLFSERLFSNTSLIFSNFDYSLETFDDAQAIEWKSSIQQSTFKQDFSFYINPKNETNFGYHGSYRRFKPGKISPNSAVSLFKTVELEPQYALDHAIYLGNEQKVSDKLTLQYGLRYSLFQNVGKSTVYEYADPQDNVDIERVDSTNYGRFENIKTFHNLEPRFSARYLLNQQSSIKVSYNRMVQNIHLISNSVVSLPFNTWMPSSTYVDPQKSDQFTLGYFRNLKDNMYEFSAEAYYKQMKNTTTFADNANVFFNEDLAVEMRTGNTDSYGLEFLVKKNKGDFTGFMSYTWSKTETEINDINEGNPFPASHDRRHNLSVVGTYKMNDKWTFGANFVYNSGRPFTLPVGKYQVENYNVDYYQGRNQYKLPAFHRLDLSATLHPRKNIGRKWQSSWTFAVYNAYNRKNPFTIYTRNKRDANDEVIAGETRKEARLIYLFPILPSVTYNITF